MFENTDFSSPFFTIDETNNLLLPLNLTIDFKNSKIDVVPSIRESTEQIAGLDGDYIYDSTYAPKLFDLVCYTPDGLTVAQKTAYKQHIATILNQCKKESKTLLYKGNIYYVKVVGSMQIDEYATWFSIPISLKAYSPFGYSQTVTTRTASSSISYSGNIENGLYVKIEGLKTNPLIWVGADLLEYIGTIPTNAYVELDTLARTSTMTAYDGTKTNALGAWKLNGVIGISKPIVLSPATSAIVNGNVVVTPSSKTITIGSGGGYTYKWREKFI